MSNYTIESSELAKLEGKVIVITGAASGIGRAIADVAHRHGAQIAVCDVDDTKGQQLKDSLKERILYQHCDVSQWNDVLSFFKETYEKFGHIDAVISNAGINSVESLDDDIDENTGELRAPNLSVLNVNTIGTCIFDTPPLYTYCASKAAVLGFMRALRTQLPKYNITVNMIAPWMTVTAMVTDHILSIWEDLPANTVEDVARASLLPVIQPSINGKTFLINGGNFTELEDKLDETQPVWLGSELDKHMREGQRRLIP